MTDQINNEVQIDPQVREEMHKMALERIKERQAAEAVQAREQEYAKRLTLVMEDPAFEPFKEELKQFANSSGLKKFGGEGLTEVINQFKEKMVEKEKAKAVSTPTIPATSADPGRSMGSAAVDQPRTGLPRREDGTVDWLSVDINTVEPSQRNEVIRKQGIQASRSASKKYGW